MDKNYDQTKETEIYKRWEDSGAFEPKGKGKPYTILMPPPNANASLHAGHAMYTVDDVLVRWKRMQGYSAQWLPGMDHAGFETQFVYEKNLAKNGQSRLDFDRQTLYNNVFDFVKNNSGLIYEQFKRLGFSANWQRSTFTLDEKVIREVWETFIKMEKEGLIYRDDYLVNFCPHCGTSLAELEVEHEERVDNLYYVKYKKVDGDGFITVATTRPEPIWADTHLAVNPKDKKNKVLIGQKVLNPLTGTEMEIIGDEFVDPEFGTGIVKLTPAHDANDFAAAQKHKLPIVSAIDLQGRMTNGAGKYAGLKVVEARKQIVEYLQNNGSIEKIDDKYLHSVNLCYKCKRILEPMVVPNWFIKVESLKEPVIHAVQKNDVKFYPSRFKKQMLDWLKIMHDWPISRQIAWGIRIPIWYNIDDNPEISIGFLDSQKKFVQGKVSEISEKYGFNEIENGLQYLRANKQSKYVVSTTKPKGNFLQETDTFDTWFSSGQWPLVTEAELPTDMLGTLADILKSWVSRMIMFSLYKKNTLPFKDVYLWSMVADSKGIKMSKSKGNVVNPIELVDKYGADALRMTLLYGVATGSSIALSEDKVRGMRNFSNKLWNISRYVSSIENKESNTKPNKDDKEIIKKVDKLTKSVTTCLEKYRFGQATEELYAFVWHEFADLYIEKSKDRKDDAYTTLSYVLDCSLKLLHPFMPFVTEAIWRQLGHNDLLISCPWPKS